jgi:hypothetical protein
MVFATLHYFHTRHFLKWNTYGHVDSGNLALLSLLDLLAAFDIVNRSVLLQRLEKSCGLTVAVHSWLASYLVNRRQSI